MSTRSSYILCVIDLCLKQFIFCIFFQFDILESTGVFAFSAVAAIHFTHHHSGVNTELTIA